MEVCDPHAAFFGFMGITTAAVFSNLGAAYGTAKSGVGISSMGVMRPDLVMRSIVPVIMAGVLGIYGLIIVTGEPATYPYFLGYAHLGAGLTVGLSALAAGLCIGIVGDAGVRANAQQPRLFVGMILILIFAEALALYGLIIGLLLSILKPKVNRKTFDTERSVVVVCMTNERDEQIRRDAEKRRWRLLHKGHERIQQLETGQTVKDSDTPPNIDTSSSASNNCTKRSSACLSPSGSPSDSQSEPALSFTKTLTSYVIEYRGLLVGLAALVSVLLSSVVPHEQGFFFRLSDICHVVFCCTQLLLHGIVTGFKPEVIHLGFLLPIFQLIISCLSFRQMFAALFLGILFVGAYLALRFPNASAFSVFQWLMDNTLHNLGRIGESLKSAADYASDYALFCAAASGSVLLCLFCHHVYYSFRETPLILYKQL